MYKILIKKSSYVSTIDIVLYILDVKLVIELLNLNSMIDIWYIIV